MKTVTVIIATYIKPEEELAQKWKQQREAEGLEVAMKACADNGTTFSL